MFCFVFMLFYFKRILLYDWSLLLPNFNDEVTSLIADKYFILSISVALVVATVNIIIFSIFCKSFIRQLKHRQLLARMILENKWYESETYITESVLDGFFGNKNRRKTQEKITSFPKMYYKFKDNHIYLLVGLTIGKAQDKLLQLQKKIETGLFCEFINFTAKEPYYEYTFYCDLDKARLSVNDIFVKKSSIEFMKGFYWNYDKRPHALIVGGTGSGKTYFLLILIKTLISFGAKLEICDPKNADLADLSTVLPNVYHEKEDIMFRIETFRESMINRTEKMKAMKNYTTGKNYASLGLKPHYLVFDEYVAFMEMLDKKQLEAVVSSLKKIAMLGRQAGYFLILACQRPDAKYLSDGVRDQFHFRVSLGFSSAQGYRMIFPEADKTFLTMPPGLGYVDMGKNVVHALYVPYVPNDYDFLKEIKRSLDGYSFKSLLLEDS